MSEDSRFARLLSRPLYGTLWKRKAMGGMTMRLGERIAVCRKKMGWSQEALAEKLSVSRQTVSRWETGEALPDVEKIVLLAGLFGVTTDALLLDEAPAEREETSPINVFDSNSPEEKRLERVERRRQGLRIAAGAFILAVGIGLIIASLIWAGWWAGETNWWYTNYGAFGTGLLCTGDIWVFISGILVFLAGIAIFVREYIRKD